VLVRRALDPRSVSRPSRQRLIEAAILALVALAALAAAAIFDGQPALESSGASTPVDAAAAGDPGDINSNNSPTLAQNPRRRADLAVVNRIDTPRYSCALHVSHDDGAGWTPLEIPIPAGEERKCYAPDIAYAADGRLYVAYVTLKGTENRPHAVWLARSDDGGRTLSPPRRVSGPLAFQVRIATDPRRAGRLYLTWLQARTVGLFLFPGLDNRIVATRSDDGGRSFSPLTRVSSDRRVRVLAPAPAVGPGGALYVLYLDVGGDRLDYAGAHDSSGGPPYAGHFSLVLGRSTDGGRRWQESLVDDRVVPTRRFIPFLPPAPSLAVDPRDGRLYVAFEDGANQPADVHLWSLPHGASRWSGPVRVNDTAADDRSTQYLPKLAVAPGGRLDVAYYDRRADPADHRNEVSVQSSFDAGRSFTPHAVVSDRSFDARIGAGSERGLPDIGSRLGLVSGPSGATVAWTDTRAGTIASNKQDIAVAEATVTRSGGLSASARRSLRYCAVALLLAALAFVLVPARSRGA
jgi:hypothetical protein